MKKIIILGFTLVILILVTGCNNSDRNQFPNFEHFNLKGKDVIQHTYVDNNGYNQKYFITEVTPDSSEILVYGLFYQVSADDYILIEKIESTEKKEYISRFYDNKLYVIGMGETSGNIEYTLNQEKIIKKEIKFEFYKGFLTRTIDDIKNNSIYYSAISNDDIDNHSIDIKIKCSLNDYKCEIIR